MLVVSSWRGRLGGSFLALRTQRRMSSNASLPQGSVTSTSTPLSGSKAMPTYSSLRPFGITTGGGAAQFSSIGEILEDLNRFTTSHASHEDLSQLQRLVAAPLPHPAAGAGSLSSSAMTGGGGGSGGAAAGGGRRAAAEVYVPHQSRIDAARAKSPSLSAVWNATENWCSLCKEPLNSWNEHRGKRDHVCLEMFFDQFVEYASQWNTDVRRHLSLYYAHRLFHTESAMRAHAHDEKQRRMELLHILKHLFDEGLLRRGRLYASSADFNVHQMHGAMALFRHQYPAISAMFPHSTAAQCSGLSQMSASLYNCETVFDLCGLRDLVGDDAPTQGVIRTQRGEVSDVGYTYKGTFLRSMLGQLRFTIDPGSVPPPVMRGAKYARSGGAVPAHLELLGKIAAKTIIAELIFCRTCEYICRVEPVWRDLMMSKKPPRPAGTLPQSVTPRLSNYGAFCYINGELHNPPRLDEATGRLEIAFTSGSRPGKLGSERKPLVVLPTSGVAAQ